MKLQTKAFLDQIIPFEQGGDRSGLKDVVAHFKKLNGEEGWGEWEVDQVERKNFLSSFFCSSGDSLKCNSSAGSTTLQFIKEKPTVDKVGSF